VKLNGKFLLSDQSLVKLTSMSFEQHLKDLLKIVIFSKVMEKNFHDFEIQFRDRPIVTKEKNHFL